MQFRWHEERTLEQTKSKTLLAGGSARIAGRSEASVPAGLAFDASAGAHDDYGGERPKCPRRRRNMLIELSETRWQQLKIITMRMWTDDERKHPGKLVEFPVLAGAFKDGLVWQLLRGNRRRKP
jgi:hypothetical protein